MSIYRCPICGWKYDPSQHDGGNDRVPDHLADSYDRLMSCVGVDEPPAKNPTPQTKDKESE
jgi:rubredoxin